ncbi:MAG: hypothetical protein ACMXYG_04050 [Candidatus Woesearchaeota archaeon]
MKYLLALLLTAFILVGCASNDDGSDLVEQLPDDDLSEVTVEDLDIDVQIDDEIVEVDVSDKTIDYEVTQSLEEWCIEGEVYFDEQPEVSIDAEIIGITIRDGIRVCELLSISIIDTPVGPIDTVTTYYLNEDISEMWAVIDTMGQVTETHIVLKE